MSFNYLMINGKRSLYDSASSQRLRSDSDETDVKVDEKRRANFLNLFVHEVIQYKDSVACVIGQYPESFYSIRFLSLENGQWLNAGEGMGESLDDARGKFAENADRFEGYLKRIRMLSSAPTDPRPFVDFLKKEGRNPKDYLLRVLAEHRLVVYGEIHRRQWSWDLCRSVINDKKFSQSTGTVFLEISSHKQDQLDLFLSKETPDRELILDAFREIQIDGWPDRGMFEFIMDVWKLNKTLPLKKRIRIVAADIPRPFGRFKTAEEQKNHFDSLMNRNATMADVIEKNMRSGRDDRHGLFIVGTSHAFKSSAPGLDSTPAIGPTQTAGSLLSARWPQGDVFVVFSHQAIVDNGGRIRGRIRNGIFDQAFHLNGGAPVAFPIDHGPFGQEPFDALPETRYDSRAGTFADNYDGYIFLGPLDLEPNDYFLYELYSDDFVKELIRRANMEKSSVQDWFGIEKADREAIIDKMKKDEGKKRWLK